MLPSGVVQFLAVVMVFGAFVVLGSLVFMHVVVPERECPRHVISPAHPKGLVATSGSLWRYLRRVYATTEEDVHKLGGADAVLAYRRTELRLKMVASFTLVALPLLVVYSVNPSGGATAGGLARSTLSNAATLSADAIRFRLWAMVAGAFGVQLLGLLLLEQADRAAIDVVAASVRKAPGHHYAVVLRGLEDGHDAAAVKEAFSVALHQGGSVLAVHRVKAYTRAAKPLPPPPCFAVRREDALCYSPWTSIASYASRRRRARRGGLRGLVATYAEALATARQREVDRRATAWFRNYAERCRRDVAAALEAGAPESNAAVVVLDSLWCATAAATTRVGLLGLPSRWKVFPAPEPRDIIWENLEDDRRFDRARLAGLVAVYCLSAAAFASVAMLARLYLTSGPGSGHLASLVASGVVPVLLAKLIMGYSHSAVRFVLYETLGAWTESGLELATQRAYARLLLISALSAPLVAIALDAFLPQSHRHMLQEYARESRDSSATFVEPPEVLRVFVVRKVPGLAFGFAAMLVYVAGDTFAWQLLRLDAYVHFLKMKRLVLSRYGHQPATFDENRDPTRTPVASYQFSGPAGFEVFALAVVAAWAPLAPAVVPVGLVYFFVALGVQKLSLAQTATPPFVADGLFWHTDVKQTRHALSFALALQLAVCLLCGAVMQFVALAPLVGLAAYCSSAGSRRYRSRSPHGLSSGRLALSEAVALDARRAPTAAPAKCAAHCAADKCWAPRPEPPEESIGDDRTLDFYPGPPLSPEDDLEDRLGFLQMWIDRYDSRRAIPTFFEISPGVEDVVFKDTTLHKLADTVWRKMRHTYRRNVKGPTADAAGVVLEVPVRNEARPGEDERKDDLDRPTDP